MAKRMLAFLWQDSEDSSSGRGKESGQFGKAPVLTSTPGALQLSPRHHRWALYLPLPCLAGPSCVTLGKVT